MHDFQVLSKVATTRLFRAAKRKRNSNSGTLRSPSLLEEDHYPRGNLYVGLSRSLRRFPLVTAQVHPDSGHRRVINRERTRSFLYARTCIRDSNRFTYDATSKPGYYVINNLIGFNRMINMSPTLVGRFTFTIYKFAKEIRELHI